MVKLVYFEIGYICNFKCFQQIPQNQRLIFAFLEAYYLLSRVFPLVKPEHLNTHMINMKDHCTGE